MLLQQKKIQLSTYSDLYDLVVPQDDLLRKINELIDFSFIYEELVSKYCLNNGHNAESPIRMFKYSLLKTIYTVSDVDVVERSGFDMSFKYFLEMTPEEGIINSNALTNFRKPRLKDTRIAKTSTNESRNGIEVDAIIGDGTYSGKENLELFNGQDIKIVVKLNPSIIQGCRKEADQFDYNKDADMVVCTAGHWAIRKAKQGKKNIGKSQADKYYFNIQKCKVCPLKEGCYKEGATTKSYSVRIKSDLYQVQAAFQETDY